MALTQPTEQEEGVVQNILEIVSQSYSQRCF